VTTYDAHLELLLAIAQENLGIETFELTGKQSADFHIVNVADIASALEAAYDAGLLVGHSVASGKSVANDEVYSTRKECGAGK
jgi:hypothetical protein